MGDYLKAIMDNGGLFNQATAARMARVGRNRICQLVHEGRLPLVVVEMAVEGGVVVLEELIPGNALSAWMKAPKAKGGRPMHRTGQSEMIAA